MSDKPAATILHGCKIVSGPAAHARAEPGGAYPAATDRAMRHARAAPGGANRN